MSQLQLENAVLRHQVRVLRRTVSRPELKDHDRAFLAAANRALSPDRWGSFMVTPQTLLRWHRELVRRKWTYRRRGPGRPDSAWVTQQARNLAITGRLEDRHILVRDRDATFSRGFDEVLRTEGLAVVRTPIRPPKANAFAERWVGFVRRECLDHVLVFGRRHLQRVLGAYVEHYNRARPHRGRDLPPPDPRLDPGAMLGTKVRRRDVLGGLIHEYHRSAA